MPRQPGRGLVPALLAALLALAGCDEGNTARSFDLSGRVMVEGAGDDTPRPLGGARVTFTSDTGLVSDATTGDDGRYEMQVESDIEFGQVRAEREGFTPSERTVYFDVPARRIDLVLRPVANDEP